MVARLRDQGVALEVEVDTAKGVALGRATWRKCWSKPDAPTR